MFSRRVVKNSYVSWFHSFVCKISIFNGHVCSYDLCFSPLIGLLCFREGCNFDSCNNRVGTLHHCVQIYWRLPDPILSQYKEKWNLKITCFISNYPFFIIEHFIHLFESEVLLTEIYPHIFSWKTNLNANWKINKNLFLIKWMD